MDAKDRIIKGIIKLVLEKPLYGLTLMYLKPVQTSVLMTSQGLVEITIAVDGEFLFFDSDFVNSVDDKDLIFILAHEAFHILAGHCDFVYKRRLFKSGENNNLIDLAMDYEANAFLVEQEKMPPVSNMLYDQKYNSEEWPAERIYEDLKLKQRNQKTKKNQKPEKSEKTEKQENGGEGSKEKSSGKGNEKGNARDKDGNEENDKKEESKGQKRTDGGFDVHLTYEDCQLRGSDRNPEELRNEWKGRIQAIIQQAMQQGKMPAGLKRKIEQRLYPKKDWREELAEFLQVDKVEYSFMPSDRRFLYQDLLIPDLNGMTKLEVVVAVDTSGSISQEMFDMFIAELRGIVNASDNVNCKLIICDATVYEVCDISDENVISDVRFKGGGGTDFRPVFKEIEDRNLNPSVVIYITDGMGTYPEEPPAYQVLWAIYNKRDVRVPFGRVIKLEK